MDARYTIQRLVNRLGYRIERRIPSDVDSSTAHTIRRVSPYTMSSSEAIAALCAATEYVVRARVPGDFVECGVWPAREGPVAQRFSGVSAPPAGFVSGATARLVRMGSNNATLTRRQALARIGGGTSSLP
jgi:hypothetical protein